VSGIYVRDGGVWKNVPDGTKFNVRSGGAWINPTQVSVRDGGIWKQVWSKSDPITLSLDALAVGNFRLNSSFTWCPAGSGSCDYFYIGAFAGSFPRDYVGVASFNSSALNSAMNTRPNVISAEVRFRRDSSAGLSFASGTFFCGTYPTAPGVGTPNYSQINMSNAGSQAFSGLGFNADLTIPLTAQVIQRIRTGNSLAGSLRTSGWATNKSTDAGYSRWRGPLTGSPGGRRPTLVVTLDY